VEGANAGEAYCVPFYPGTAYDEGRTR
jgi:hypothetical protein